MERLKRVVYKLLPDSKWPNLNQDETARLTVAKFLVNPDDFSLSIPEFIRRCFYIREGWVKALRDYKQVTALVINVLKSDYAVKCGLAQEKKIINQVDKLSIPWEKGRIAVVNNKEVDIAIPNLTSPVILIMSSYQITTSSAQSSRANEQTLMYEDILRENRRNPRNTPIQLWNVIDGGGWISRVKDLNKMILNSDASFCNQDIDEGMFYSYLKSSLRNKHSVYTIS